MSKINISETIMHIITKTNDAKKHGLKEIKVSVSELDDVCYALEVLMSDTIEKLISQNSKDDNNIQDGGSW